MNRTRAHIRPYQPGDLGALYRICLLTGARPGSTGTPASPKLPATDAELPKPQLHLFGMDMQITP